MSKWDDRFLGLAKYISQWSKDPSTQVGAVVTDRDNRIISLGFNGFARGVEDLPERLANRDVKYKMVVHAESNAILFARQDLKGATLYVWPFMPCASCAAKIIQTGIRRVVSVPNDNPRWQADFDLTRMMFKEAGVTLYLAPPEVL